MVDNKKDSKKRIQYIDAMRGFTMFLVVFSHVNILRTDFSSEYFSFNDLFVLFRMPLFFFVSGFVFYNIHRTWSCKEIVSFVKKKIQVQIITPILFLFCFAYVKGYPFADCLLAGNKYGYWFTFSLFEFFIIYIVFYSLLKVCKCSSLIVDISFVILGLIVFFSIGKVFDFAWIPLDIWNIFGFGYLRFFLFFVLGTIAKKFFGSFVHLIDNGHLLTVCVFVFFVFNIFKSSVLSFSYSAHFLLCAISGIVLVFSFFRKYESFFSSEKKCGAFMQFVGRRTLDIYLIHYFLLPDGLKDIVGGFFCKYNVPILEFLFSLSISFVIVVICLIISNVYRLSPFVAKYLFGEKQK